MHFNVYIKHALILMVWTLSVSLAQAGEPFDSVREALERAESLHIDIPAQTNKHAEDAARNASRYLDSKEFLDAVDRQKKRIRTLNTGSEEHKDQSKTNPCLTDTDRLFIFISSSVPLDTLRAYVRDLDYLKEPNITLVLRGFVGGMKKVRPTLDFIESLVKQDLACEEDSSEPCSYYRANIDIDPLAFRYFNIERVPAMAYIDHVRLANPDESIGTPGNIKTKGTPQVYYGDMPLAHVLSQLGKIHPKLGDLTDRLTQRGFYHEQ